MEMQEIVNTVRRVFPKAAIVCRGNWLSVIQRFSQEILAILDIERREDFAGLITEARKFIIEASHEETWDQIGFSFEFESLLLEPGFISIAEGGETETFDYNHLSPKEIRDLAKARGFSERYMISEDFIPGDFESLVKETERFKQWRDRPYKDYSITNIDKVSRWTKLREIAISGDFPMDKDIAEPNARTEETMGLFKLSTEFDGKFHWVLQDQQKANFAGICIYAEDISIVSDMGDDYADIEILFSVEVFDEK